MSSQKDPHTTEKKIINAAKTLFLKQGFNNSSVRQIVKEAGVTTGSLYHFFSNKEAILQAILSEVLRTIYSVAEQKKCALNGREYMPFFYEMVIFVRLVDRYENVRDLLACAHDSIVVSDAIVASRVGLMQEWFGKVNPTLTERDFYHRALFVKGILRSILMYKMSHPEDKLDEQLHLLIITCAKMLNISEAECATIWDEISGFPDDELPAIM